MNYTPEQVTTLKPNEVFVFASNDYGLHGGGSARTAFDKFGATWGNGDGPSGQSYAISTVDKNWDALPLDIIEENIKRFVSYAVKNKDKTFLFTKIGTGIAGYTVKDIAGIVKKQKMPKNVVLPREFAK